MSRTYASGSIRGSMPVALMLDIFQLNTSIFGLSTMDFLVSMMNLLDSIFLHSPWYRFRLASSKLFFVLHHILLYFLRVPERILPGRDLDHLSDDHLESAYARFIKFAEIINYFDEMHSPESSQSRGIFCFANTQGGDLVVPGKSAVDEVVPIGDPNAA
jgi:hypothetical protein